MAMKPINHPASDETLGRLALATEHQNNILAAIASGSAGAEFVDATFTPLLDGKNTTEIFWQWWQLSAKSATEQTKYQRLERFGKMLAKAWAKKTYTVRTYAAAASSNEAGTPLDDLADGRSAAVLATDKAPGGTDWAEEDPMTWYIRANAISLADGTMNVLAIEGEDGFDIGGDTAPVYAFAMALWRREVRDESYTTTSWRTTRAAGFTPMAGDVAPDNTKRVLTWHPCFGGGLTAAGALTSGAGKKVYNFASASSGIVAARKMSAFEGLWNDCDTMWILDQWKLRHWSKENSGILEGCTSYNYQYKAALAEANTTRVLLTTAQAANLVQGSTVSVGNCTNTANIDRGQAYMRDLADQVPISNIVAVTIGGVEYAAVNLGVASSFSTTDTTYISTMPWMSGNTEGVPGHKDGCTGSLTNGKYPIRVAGIEMMNGAYVLGLDPLYNVTANAVGGYDYEAFECRNSEKLSGSITADYKATGIKVLGIASGWNWVKEFVYTTLGVLFPSVFGGNSTGWYKSAFYGSGGAGVRLPWRFYGLGNGTNAGFAGEDCSVPPGNWSWHGAHRLSGAGKKRGEWAA